MQYVIKNDSCENDVQITSTCSYYKHSRSLPYFDPNSRTPRHWMFTQHPSYHPTIPLIPDGLEYIWFASLSIFKPIFAKKKIGVPPIRRLETTRGQMFCWWLHMSAKMKLGIAKYQHHRFTLQHEVFRMPTQGVIITLCCVIRSH